MQPSASPEGKQSAPAKPLLLRAPQREHFKASEGFEPVQLLLSHNYQWHSQLPLWLTKAQQQILSPSHCWSIYRAQAGRGQRQQQQEKGAACQGGNVCSQLPGLSSAPGQAPAGTLGSGTQWQVLGPVPSGTLGTWAGVLSRSPSSPRSCPSLPSPAPTQGMDGG